MAEVIPIPQPPGLPLVGNLGEFTSSPIQDVVRLCNTYGEIFKLHLGSRPMIFVSSNKLVNEICDEKRFHKTLQSALRMVREGVHDGLFTAHDDEPNWGKAHRVLIPAFGPFSIRGMFDEMHDIASQLCMKLARHGSKAAFNASDDFTRLALDTLALCAMDYRFNSYYHEEMHPFIRAMGDFLTEAGRRNKRPAFAPNFLYRAANDKYWRDIATMRDTADEVVAHRRQNPSGRRDLLNAMLNGVDPATGERLSDENITDQLNDNPSAYRKVQREIDEVIGREAIRVEHLTKLPYLASVLRETLRLSSGIPGFSVEANEDTLLDGKYLVRKGEPITAFLLKAPRRSRGLWPRRHGVQARADGVSQLLETVWERQTGLHRAAVCLAGGAAVRGDAHAEPQFHNGGCRLQPGDAGDHDHQAQGLLHARLAAARDEPDRARAGPCGQGGRWIESLGGKKEMEGLSYAVFGCGHHDWTQTFQRVPKLVDATLQRLGGGRLLPLATTDAADRDMFSDFETWEDGSLWPALQERYGTTTTEEDTAGGGAAGLDVEISFPRKTTLRQDVEEAIVLSAKTLAAAGPVKRHIEIRLPTGMTYRAGDYLAVLPFNPKSTVSRVFRRFRLSWDAMLNISSDGPTSLPTETVISAADVLGAYVELSQPATKRNIQSLAEPTQDGDMAGQLRKLAGDDYADHISAKRASILDLLERFPDLDLPFASYLSMLPPMRVRQYSISSSPLADRSSLTLTYSVLRQAALSGHGPHHGVASNFLSSLTAGERLHVAVRPSQAFHLPPDAETTPIVCIAAGSGLAPFRGFVQERAAMMAAGRAVAPALLFFGCRAPDTDDLYAEELSRWEALGAVDVRRAYSRAPDASHGCRYVQHRLSRDRDDVARLWDRGARVYVCGSRDVGAAVEDVFLDMVKEAGRKRNGSGEEPTTEAAKEWFDRQRNERYLTDVFD
ncbi:hypothetical protein E4U41_003768 [Claviceps citrina]|nr:hypothetical protein E4U41_003768 [Claviceps citrina]